MSFMNRASNSGNRFQGKFKRVLCVCSAGLLRSPTAAVVLSQDPYNFNTRAVGVTKEYALVPLDTVHVVWADEVVTFEDFHTDAVYNAIKEADERFGTCSPVVRQLNVPDSFAYRDPKLMELIRQRYDESVAKTA